MRFREIMEVAVHRDDPAMDDYNDERGEQEQDMRDAPYYVSWHAQSWEWYGDDNGPEGGNGRHKAKGDGGRIVAINIPEYEQAMEIANKLDASYDDGSFEDKNVYGDRSKDWYVLEYHGADVSSMSRMDQHDRETIANAHPRWAPKDYA